MPRFSRPVLVVVALVTIFRGLVAAHVPLTEDETYYWTWSLHPAWGYLDHPPVVAWAIAVTSFLGHGPLAVRLAFVAFETCAALFVGATAGELSGERRAADAAAIAFLLIPQIRFALGEALPDPPYLFFWALALWMAARLQTRATRLTFVVLGVALGGALLSRFFGWALVCGIAAWSYVPRYRRLWRDGLWISFALALALYGPFVAYDAAQGWQNLHFTLYDRQPLVASHLAQAGFSSAFRFLAFAAAFCAVAYFATVRARHALLAWTAIPFVVALAVLSPFENVESYWMLGPLASLCTGIGIAFVGMKRPARVALQLLLYAGAAVVAIGALVTAFPEPAQAAMRRAGAVPSGSLYDGVYMWGKVAPQVSKIAAARRATVVTGIFETDSEMEYYGLTTVLVGADGHVRQWRRWHPGIGVPGRALFVSYNRSDPALQSLLARAYRKSELGPDIPIDFAGARVGEFYTTFYSDPRPGSETVLWPKP